MYCQFILIIAKCYIKCVSLKKFFTEKLNTEMIKISLEYFKLLYAQKNYVRNYGIFSELKHPP